jgi:hypothetical protein
VTFPPSIDASFAINGNWEKHIGPAPLWEYARYWLICECNFEAGSFAAHDFGSANQNVFYVQTIVQRCRYHNLAASDWTGQAWIAWYKSALEVTWRDCEAWELNESPYHLCGTDAHPANVVPRDPPYTTPEPKTLSPTLKVYRMRFHRKASSLTNSAYLWAMFSASQFTDNEFVDLRTTRANAIVFFGNFANLDELLLMDRNRYYTPNYGIPRLVRRYRPSEANVPLAAFNRMTGNAFDQSNPVTGGTPISAPVGWGANWDNDNFAGDFGTNFAA